MDARASSSAIAAIVLAATAMLTQKASAQESYQTEVTAGYVWVDVDSNPDIELTAALIEGTYNFRPVSLEDHPWNEAAFLEHSMQVMLGLAYYDFEVGASDADGLVYGTGFRYADKESPFAAEIHFQTGTLDGGSDPDVDLTSLSVLAGYWVEPNAIVGLAFGFDELDPDGAFKIEETSIAAFGKIVHKLDDQRALNGEARVGWTEIDDGTDDDTNLEITFLGDYYFTPQLSVGALVDISVGSAESAEGTTLGARGSMWFSPQVGLQVQLSRFWASDSDGNDEDTLGAFFSVRF